ncbi:MAG: hypothetical protein HY598_02060 [Candidatus Omnitrophica bacterium]|nr:hypothetical protein [Candidatus Omnitrophota bacterium]
MVVVEIPSNSNCDPVDLRVFHDVDARRVVRQVCLQRVAEPPAWYDLTGWTLGNRPCPAVACRVDDSGEGQAVLVIGGEAGLRLRPAGSDSPWSLEDPSQWGAGFLLMADEAGVLIFDEIAHG